MMEQLLGVIVGGLLVLAGMYIGGALASRR